MELFQWPPDLQEKVVGIALAKDLVPVVRQMATVLKPHRGGSTSNPFFCLNEGIPAHPAGLSWNKVRTTGQPLFPEVMKPFYEAYSSDVEFCANGGLVFLSEDETLQNRLSCTQGIDLAYRYMGMGHIMVYSYLKRDDVVLSCIDGGANGYDRNENSKKRKEMWKALVAGSDTTDQWSKVRSFVDWWNDMQCETEWSHG